jgi:NAD(P)-dependent dehydrogenase (short-subunit alcohol dehydrogenase family)
MSDPEFAKGILARKSLGYMGEPEIDIGGVVVFFASDASQYVTGEIVKADGGM